MSALPPDCEPDPEAHGIEYPCEWEYRIIGETEELIRAAVAAVIHDRPASLEPSNRSRSGKFVSLRLLIEVADQEDRDGLFVGLRDGDGVRMVL